ncbi:MAG: cytochrome c biogenesis protein DipZ [Candidatus Kaiserbacteria bacterium]|nr:MAG: cytochrome c biogenesis protein DipZ [Candidatus Kaiserbacteria bacterium]
MVLLLVSFVAGVLTVLAPCVLPLLPVIVGGSLAGGSRRRAYVITASLALSIVVFTLVLKASTALIGVPEEIWRYLSGIIVMVFGLFLLFPDVWASIPGVNALNIGSNKLLARGYQKGSFWGDALMGAALGPVFAGCSPTYFIILATVLPVQPLVGIVYLAAYAAGLSLMLLLIAFLGDRLVQKLGITIEPRGWFRRGIGALFVIVGVLVFTGVMRDIEVWFVEKGLNFSQLEYLLLGNEEARAAASVTDLSPEAKATAYEKAPELVSPAGYLNTEGEPITLESLRGKVVLLDFWTYSCINCQRTFPYLRMWYEKYKDQGLEIVGIHTPEFAFEKVKANVENAATRFGLTYPIVQDNDYETWRAYGNQYWPRKYLVDIDGYIVYDHIGEGAYEETEQAIQRALAERARRLGQEMPQQAAGEAPETVAVEPGRVGSPEIYFGSSRNEYLGNGVQYRSGTQNFTLPDRIFPNVLYLGGRWEFTDEAARSASAGAEIRFTYTAKNVYLVASAESGVRIKVTHDGGKALGATRGADVDADGYVRVTESGLYHLVENDDYETHLLEITIEGAGLEAYTFTFG